MTCEENGLTRAKTARHRACALAADTPSACSPGVGAVLRRQPHSLPSAANSTARVPLASDSFVAVEAGEEESDEEEDEEDEEDEESDIDGGRTGP